MDWRITDAIVPAVLAAVGTLLLALWVSSSGPDTPALRVPGLDRPGGPAADTVPPRAPPEAGQSVLGPGRPSTLSGQWPCFRGPERDGICHEPTPLRRNWPPSGPPVLWTITLGEGYAGAAISGGCAYVLDYDEPAQSDTLRCLSLDDGQEVWHNSYPVELIASHGITRTTPAIADGRVITIGPRCHVACWDAASGACHWLIDLELEYGTITPRWYTGQCPLIDGDRLILAPSGQALLVAIDLATGKPIWKTPNPRGWKMTHVSVVPMQWQQQRTYVYCTTAGVVGVSADDGRILWEYPDWIEQFAIAPSPVVLPGDRLFLSSGYDKKVGSVLLQLLPGSGKPTVQMLRQLSPREFNSEQQTPILYDGHLLGIRKQGNGQLVCLDLEGNEIWNSGRDRFGHGPYLIADGAVLALSTQGRLVMAEANTQQYRPLASHQVFDGGIDAWGPMALVQGRLILRDMTRMTCLDLNVAE